MSFWKRIFTRKSKPIETKVEVWGYKSFSPQKDVVSSNLMHHKLLEVGEYIDMDDKKHTLFVKESTGMYWDGVAHTVYYTVVSSEKNLYGEWMYPKAKKILILCRYANPSKENILQIRAHKDTEIQFEVEWDKVDALLFQNMEDMEFSQAHFW